MSHIEEYFSYTGRGETLSYTVEEKHVSYNGETCLIWRRKMKSCLEKHVIMFSSYKSVNV
jgi:hypothetical protein